MCSMQTGSHMTKLKGKKKGLLRFFYLDEHKSCVRWRPSRKQDRAKSEWETDDVIKGKKSEMFRRYADNRFDPNCCFSIYYGERVRSLDLVSTNSEEARTWVTGLKYLMAGRRSSHLNYSLTWLQQTFSEADKNGDGTLSISEVHQLLNVFVFLFSCQEADTDENQGSLAFEEFCSFYKMISTRRDLYLIMISYSNQKEVLDLQDLAHFLENEQKVNTLTCAVIGGPLEGAQRFFFSVGFTNYMRSPAGDVFNPEHQQVNQDMTQPLNSYFIATSHNTYLTGDQLLSQSRVEMYAYVLQAGCRCVEVDCWDGPDGEPIIHHGYTLTSKILFRDVIETINKHAFTKSQYPVILSIENHCTVPQQKRMAQCLTEVLQDKLDLSNVNVHETKKLPSPESLKGKVLVKRRRRVRAPKDSPVEGPREAPEDRQGEAPLEAPEETDSGFKPKLKSQPVVMAPSQPVLQTLLHPTTKPPPIVPPSSPTPVRRTFGAPFTPNQSSLIWTKARSLSCPRKQSPVLNHTHQTGHLANGRCLDQCSSSSSSVDSLELVPSCRSVGTRQKDGTLQREMKALFDQKIKELRCKSPLFLDEKL
uniref:Phosphoinositide phospholipase C n=1 Tax=Cynoglossus semilaevis TaxID=244447 RepID=A0A3P8X429_CYNSE